MKYIIQLSLFPELVPPVVYKVSNIRNNKLTKDEVEEIRQKLLSGEFSQATLAKKYCVTQQCISDIKNHVTWT
jgi:hypothetical protein